MNRQLDRMVAEKITKVQADILPAYSSNLKMAWQVVEALSKQGIGVAVMTYPEGVEVSILNENGRILSELFMNAHPAEVVCRAALEYISSSSSAS